MAQKFSLDTSKINMKEAAAKVTNLGNKEHDEYIDYELLDQCEWNEETIEEKEVEEIKESLVKNGLIHNLTVFPKGNGRYRILSGNTRYVSIGRAIEEGSARFNAGVRCHVLDAGTSETDQRIIMDEANIKQRSYTPDKLRKAIGRLTELYKQKNQESGQRKNLGVAQKVSETAGIKVRQTQKYQAVNEKLIPELQQLFDQDKLDLNKAASYAQYPVEIQTELVALVEENSSNSKKKIDILLSEADEKRRELEEKISELSSDQEILAEENKVYSKKIEEKEKELDRIVNEKQTLEEKLKQAISEVSNQKNASNNEEIQKLKSQLQTIVDKEEAARELKDISLKQLRESEKKIADLQQQLEKEKNKKPTVDATQIEEKVVAQYELKALGKDIIEKLNLYKMNVATYQKLYGEEEMNLIYDNIKKII